MNLIAPLKDLEIDKIDWFRSNLKNWSNNNLRSYPWRETTDAYAIFVAEFMLQKTTADTVVPVYRSFLEKYPNITSLASASIAEIAAILQPLGLFFRAERLSRAARIILDQIGGASP